MIFEIILSFIFLIFIFLIAYAFYNDKNISYKCYLNASFALFFLGFVAMAVIQMHKQNFNTHMSNDSTESMQTLKNKIDQVINNQILIAEAIENKKVKEPLKSITVDTIYNPKQEEIKEQKKVMSWIIALEIFHGFIVLPLAVSLFVSGIAVKQSSVLNRCGDYYLREKVRLLEKRFNLIVKWFVLLSVTLVLLLVSKVL